MAKNSGSNMLILHSGGPTAVINCSLVGSIEEAVKHGSGEIYGARYGIKGALHEDFIDLRKLSHNTVAALKRSPASALGSSRYRLSEDDYTRLLTIFKKRNIHHLLINGGNGSMAGALKLHRFAQEQNYQLQVIGIPATIDNDILHTDRCPGFASGARYVAQSVRDVGEDIKSLPTPISIFETMGRNAGWLAGASSLSRADDDSAPHLIYLPERPLAIDRFLSDIETAYKKRGWVVVAVSEGLRGEDGKPIYTGVQENQHNEYGQPPPGDVASFLAGKVSAELKLRSRSEKPGLCGRCSMLHVSPVDQKDAHEVGQAAVKAALAGESGKMVTLEPLGEQKGVGSLFCEAPFGPFWKKTPDPFLLTKTGLVDLEKVAGVERLVPDKWIDSEQADVSEELTKYIRPLIGAPLLEYAGLT